MSSLLAAAAAYIERMGFKRKSSARKTHSGIRPSKLPVAASTTKQTEPTAQQHVVQELDPAFAYSEIPDEVLVGNELDLSRVFHACPSLEKLDLSFCGAASDQLLLSLGQHQWIAALAFRCSKLHHLDISRCPSIGDGTLHFLATRPRELAELNVSGCVRVTHAGVRQLLTSARKLTTLSVSECEQVNDRAGFRGEAVGDRENRAGDEDAALVQAHFRGRRGRERCREMVLLKKKRWKEVVRPENGQKFYYNKETGEVRFRRPQDVLDVLPKPLCDNCGGRRRLHEFRALYDFYEKRVDYGDGEFPSKWPSEVEQDEMDGWALRMYPRRQPVEIKGSWEKYVDSATGKEWFYNKETEASRYSPPSGFQQPSSESSTSDQQSLVNDWTKYYDESQGLAYYYSMTLESTYSRQANIQTARRGNVTIETGGNDWTKYYDLSQSVYYCYNARTLESSLVRPQEFATPRVAPSEAATRGMAEFHDPATAKAYFFNAQTAECQLAASSAPGGMATVRGGRHDYR